MVFFYRRFLPLDVFIYAFGAENAASSSNLPIPFVKTTRLPQILNLRQPLFSLFQFAFYVLLSFDVISRPFAFRHSRYIIFRHSQPFAFRHNRHIIRHSRHIFFGINRQIVFVVNQPTGRKAMRPQDEVCRHSIMIFVIPRSELPRI